ncbi:MAG: universal stress protein [Actinomycetota bacterium]
MSQEPTTSRPTVVGIDGSPNAAIAVQWAADNRDSLGPIELLACWDYPLVGLAATAFGGAPMPSNLDMEKAAIEAAESFVADHGFDAPLTVEHGDAGMTLCEHAEGAPALVVGTRGRGPLRANLAGSVSRWCADHSPVPLIIVPGHLEPGDPSPNRDIVVGVDGSATSIAALRWAAETFPEATITAVSSWQTPIDGPVLFGVERFDVTVFRANARAVVEEAADKVCADLGLDADRIGRRIAEGDPRWTLLHEQEEADLLVVGRRGHSGLAHVLLGSTTTSLIHQPRCPIAVIPAAEEST